LAEHDDERLRVELIAIVPERSHFCLLHFIG
jgi:hypothetical protein